MNVVAYRKIFYTISGVMCLLSLIVIIIFGLRPGLDFTGGTLMEIEYASSRPNIDSINKIFYDLGIQSARIQGVGERGYVLRFRDVSETEHEILLKKLANNEPDISKVLQEKQYSNLGPSIGKELKYTSFQALALVVLFIAIYVAWAFRKVSAPVSSWKYGVVTLIALMHDVVIPAGVFAVLGKFYGVEVDSLFITGLLTILGFSVHDTIVVFDRIREKLRMSRVNDFATVVQSSIQETFVRSINTSLTAVVAMFAVFLFGGESTRYFSLLLIIGIGVGTYSSIFIASPLLVTWERFKKIILIILHNGSGMYMSKVQLPVKPREAVTTALKTLSNKRLRDVIEKRFGIRGPRMTLDAIGKTYGITRERVRQIENDALRQLKKPEVVSYLNPIYGAFEEYLKNHGGIVAKKDLVDSVAESNERAHTELLLSLHPAIKEVQETEEYADRLAIDREAVAVSEKILKDVTSKLNQSQKPLAWTELHPLVSDTAHGILGQRPKEEVVSAHVRMSKLIQKNPYGEYGLISWPTIQPKSIRDKAYVVLMKAGKPLHFQDVASAIDQSGFRGKKKAHPQTVHNELIKDSERFVLVGRGLYALRDWGYEAGTVRDVIQAVFKKENKAMTKEEVVSAVMKHRFVKENTILLNLQNKDYFKKAQNGTYYLA